MKLCYPIATPEVRAAILGAKGAPEAILPALRDAGYAAIEPFVGDPDAFDSFAWSAAVERSGLAVVALGTGPVVFDHKLTFTDTDASVRRAAIARAKTIVDLAARLGTQINIGKLRGDLAPGDAAQTSHDWMRAAFSEVCAHAEARGVVVTLEPQNRTIINNLNTTAESLAWLHDLALPNLKLMLDVFHMNHEREDIPTSLVAAREVLLHVHYADTDRRAPGDGDFDFVAITRALRAVGYNRTITVEIKQDPDVLSAARRSAGFLLPLLNAS